MPSSVSQLVTVPFRAWRGTRSSASVDARRSSFSFSSPGLDGSNLLLVRRPTRRTGPSAPTEPCWPNQPRHTLPPVGARPSRPRLNRKRNNEGLKPWRGAKTLRGPECAVRAEAGRVARLGRLVPPQPARGRLVPMTTRTPPPPPGGQRPRLIRLGDCGRCPRCWSPESLANSREGRKHQGCPTLQVVTPARRRWVTGSERAVRPHHDWLLPCDITRLGEKCERERESEPQRPELQAKQGPPLGTPSPPPAPGPVAHPANSRGLWLVPPSVGASGARQKQRVSNSAEARGRGAPMQDEDLRPRDPLGVSRGGSQTPLRGKRGAEGAESSGVGDPSGRRASGL